MTTHQVLDLARETLILAIKVGSPALLTIMIIGLVISIFQAATQINEQTLTFIPKILAVSVVLLITGPWILQSMIVFTKEIFRQLPTVTK